MRKQEIKKLLGFTTQKGYTIIPLKVFFNQRGLVKIDIVVAKGRHTYDKKRKIKEDIIKRETDRDFKRMR